MKLFPFPRCGPNSRQYFSATLNSTSLKSTLPVDAEAPEAFKYTSGRWLYNESKRLAERELHFNIPALLNAAARSLGRTRNDVKSFRKLADGGFNRVFELTMRDGIQVIARLPYPVTQPKRLVVASEVATMDLARRSGVPVPIVLGYSADATNDVGAEYILMEKVRGRSLGDIWFSMSDKERAKVLTAVVKCEAKLVALDLPANGSLFYDQDLPQTMERCSLLHREMTATAPPAEKSEQAATKLCIGPDVSLKFWFEKRSALEGFARKPFKTPQEVLLGGALKEKAWLKSYGKTHMPFDRIYSEIQGFEPSRPEAYEENLQRYIEIVPDIIPAEEEWLHKSTLRHPDLNPNNIFVSEDFEITGIIGWQHSKILPLFLHAGIPAHFQNHGDPGSEELVKPQLPANLDSMDEDDRQSELEQYRRRHVHFCYVGATAKYNERHFDAILSEGGLFRRRIYEHSAEPWEGNNMPLKADLVQATRSWDEIVPSWSDQCPITFIEKEAEETLKMMREQETVDRQMEMLRALVGAGTDGWVSNEGYEAAMAKAAELKAQAIETAEDEAERESVHKYWPFDDFDETGRGA